MKIFVQLSGSSNSKNCWTKHIFVLFTDRLCFLVQPVNDKEYMNSGGNDNDIEKPTVGRENSIGSHGDEFMTEEMASMTRFLEA
jgi:hypothetical protein